VQTPIKGFILVDKPSGISSHIVISCLRRLTGVRRIGHAGTLDPLASGLLICAVGREYTRQIGQFLKGDKEYEAELYLGLEMDTYDVNGRFIAYTEEGLPSLTEIEKALPKFLGKQDQLPPVYSAKRVHGQKSYKLVRKGKTVILDTSLIEIHGLEILSYEAPFLRLRVACSSGTYIRSLAHDLGEVFGTGACLSALRRTKSSSIPVESASKLDDLTEINIIKQLHEVV
jgi:tRNA pseudouridine55 synthase